MSVTISNGRQSSRDTNSPNDSYQNEGSSGRYKNRRNLSQENLTNNLFNVLHLRPRFLLCISIGAMTGKGYNLRKRPAERECLEKYIHTQHRRLVIEGGTAKLEKGPGHCHTCRTLICLMKDEIHSRLIESNQRETICCPHTKHFAGCSFSFSSSPCSSTIVQELAHLLTNIELASSG